MTRDEIAAIITSTGRHPDRSLRDADPADKAEIYTQLGLTLTYQPGEQHRPSGSPHLRSNHWVIESVRGGT